MNDAFDRAWFFLKASMEAPPPPEDEDWDDENVPPEGVSIEDWIQEYKDDSHRRMGLIPRMKSERPDMPFGPRGPKNPDGTYVTDLGFGYGRMSPKPDPTDPSTMNPGAPKKDPYDAKIRDLEEETHGLSLDEEDDDWNSGLQRSSDKAFNSVWSLLKQIS